MASYKSYVYNSSNLDSSTYNITTKELIMKFRNGTFYSFQDIPFNIVEGIATAQSSGSYFYQNIRLGNYRYKKL